VAGNRLQGPVDQHPDLLLLLLLLLPLLLVLVLDSLNC
jgi:hypothetical protein